MWGWPVGYLQGGEQLNYQSFTLFLIYLKVTSNEDVSWNSLNVIFFKIIAFWRHALFCPVCHSFSLSGDDRNSGRATSKIFRSSLIPLVARPRFPAIVPTDREPETGSVCHNSVNEANSHIQQQIKRTICLREAASNPDKAPARGSGS